MIEVTILKPEKGGYARGEAATLPALPRSGDRITIDRQMFEVVLVDFEQREGSWEINIWTKPMKGPGNV